MKSDCEICSLRNVKPLDKILENSICCVHFFLDTLTDRLPEVRTPRALHPPVRIHMDLSVFFFGAFYPLLYGWSFMFLSILLRPEWILQDLGKIWVNWSTWYTFYITLDYVPQYSTTLSVYLREKKNRLVRCNHFQMIACIAEEGSNTRMVDFFSWRF